jgi:hypothetical protein
MPVATSRGLERGVGHRVPWRGMAVMVLFATRGRIRPAVATCPAFERADAGTGSVLPSARARSIGTCRVRLRDVATLVLGSSGRNISVAS